jgi:6-pyruvoyltetrahydropterin/6-carboxytetrahydropterin synthase
MNRFAVTQQVHFCYGHRLLDYEGKCAHLHGHNAVAELTFESESLDKRGMVVDFIEIKSRFRSWIENALDHKLMLRADDPLAAPLEKLGEPIFRMQGNPTAENIAQLLFEKAESLRLPVTQVKVWETPTQFAVYRKPAS